MPGNLPEDQYTFMISLAHFLLELEMLLTEVLEKIKTHILCSCRLWRNVRKYNRRGQATDDNMAHAHCMPDT